MKILNELSGQDASSDSYDDHKLAIKCINILIYLSILFLSIVKNFNSKDTIGISRSLTNHNKCIFCREAF